ncbi:hypothetical protein [Ekhidna sp.]|uniref:hypothetical protein n=1 Tax=Ekhidna sp. TaxID=2608089 RepID=UPI003B5CB67A
MNRKTYIKTQVLALGSFVALPTLANSLVNQDATVSTKMIKEFVSAGHNNIDKVKELLAEQPNLIYARHDWGGGDFEEAIEGAGHVGNKEIATFLIEKGARPNLFVMAMLGENQIVKSTLEAYPALLSAKGPHGFSLLHHANVGGNEGLSEYLKTKGLSEKKFEMK